MKSILFIFFSLCLHGLFLQALEFVLTSKAPSSLSPSPSFTIHSFKKRPQPKPSKQASKKINKDESNQKQELSKVKTKAMGTLVPITPTYPKLSQMLEEEGTVRIQIKVSIHGKLKMAQIKKSSGHKRLDHSAMEAVKDHDFSYLKTKQKIQRNFEDELVFHFKLKKED
ncbi:MAG: energy transducer TonB [Bacteriovoracaceae bacterium]